LRTTVNYHQLWRHFSYDFFFNFNKATNWRKKCSIFAFQLRTFNDVTSAPCCLPLRSCSHYNHADPTILQRTIVSENCRENERGRGLHVGSVSSRTSNTDQRTAPRRYVQKWRSSRSIVRRRRRSPSPTFANVRRHESLADRPGGAARRQSEEEPT